MARLEKEKKKGGQSRDLVMADQRDEVRVKVADVISEQPFINAKSAGGGVFLAGIARKRLIDIAKLAPKDAPTLFVLCDLGFNLEERYQAEQPYVVVESRQLVALMRNKRRLDLIDDRRWVEDNSDLIRRFLAGEEIKKPETATQAEEPELSAKPNGLKVSMQFAEVITRILAKVDELAVVSENEEASIREAIRVLGLDPLDDGEIQLAKSLAEQARQAIIEQKRQVGTEALREPILALDTEACVAMDGVGVPTITREGVSYIALVIEGDAAPGEHLSLVTNGGAPPTDGSTEAVAATAAG